MSLPASLFTSPHRIAPKPRPVEEWGSVQLIDPPCLPEPTLSPAQQAGLRYERRVGEYLANWASHLGCHLWAHQWIEYDGKFAQLDYAWLFASGSMILFEVKQTWVDCHEQLDFYSSLLDALHYDVIPVVVCKNLAPGAGGRVVHDPAEFFPYSVWQVRI